MTPEKILEIARKELGTKESPANSNRVKYNTSYYGKEVSGSNYAWCAVFVWWCFREAGASDLYYGGKKTAYCPSLMSFHKGQAVKNGYQPGDVVFFNFSGGTSAKHVGICEGWDGKSITTIDGNTGTGNEANGGAVMRRKRDKKYIVGAYRPKYQKEEDDMTEAQVKQITRAVVKEVLVQQAQVDKEAFMERFRECMNRYRQELGQLPAPDWAVKSGEWEKAEKAGIIADKSRPQDLVTRVEAAAMIVRAEKG